MENTPCARDALVHGIAGSLVIGALYFMKSSKPPLNGDYLKNTLFLSNRAELVFLTPMPQMLSVGHVTSQWVDLL